MGLVIKLGVWITLVLLWDAEGPELSLVITFSLSLREERENTFTSLCPPFRLMRGGQRALLVYASSQLPLAKKKKSLFWDGIFCYPSISFGFSKKSV